MMYVHCSTLKHKNHDFISNLYPIAIGLSYIESRYATRANSKGYLATLLEALSSQKLEAVDAMTRFRLASIGSLALRKT